MKIAISSEGKEMDSKISEVSGRAPFYLIFEDKELIETIKNPFAIGGGGAGFGVVKMLEKADVMKIISGKFGENMKTYMDEKKIEYEVINDKTVKEVLEELE